LPSDKAAPELPDLDQVIIEGEVEVPRRIQITMDRLADQLIAE